MASETRSSSDDDAVEALKAEIAELRTRLSELPQRATALEERLLETKGQLAHADV